MIAGALFYSTRLQSVLTQQEAVVGPQQVYFSDVAPDHAAQFAQFATDLEALRQQYHIPGMSVGVVQGDEFLFAQGFGYADVEREVPASEHTVYRIASLTKPIAATVIMQLVAEGRLDLDAEFAAYDPTYAHMCQQLRFVFRPAYNCDSQHITVRHHLTHTAQGIPGEQYIYNSDLYAPLSRVVNRVTGQSFEQVLNERIVVPLQMSRSAASQQHAPPEVLADLAQPYSIDGTGHITLADYPELEVSAAAGILSTVPDLAKFSLALDQNRLVSAEMREAMFTPTLSNSGETLPYGMGWFVQNVEGTRLVWHYGWWPGAFSSLLLKVPDQQLTFIVLANSDGASAPFGLGESGDVLRSPFATTFLATFTGSDALDIGQR